MIAYRCEKDQRNLPQWNPYTVSWNNNGVITPIKHDFPLLFASNRTFNEPVTIGKNTNNCYGMFQHARNFNSPVQVWAEICSNMFANCQNLNQNIQIMNGVKNCSNMFINCILFNQNVKIPDSVTNCSSMFYRCNNLNFNIQIPNSVTNCSDMFGVCSLLNFNVMIPDSVTDCSLMFTACHNLNQNIKIPDSVTNCSHMFSSCIGLNYNIQIPNYAVDCSGMFRYSNLMTFGNVYIPKTVMSIASMFGGSIGGIILAYNKEINVYIKGNTFRDLNICCLFGGAAGSTTQEANSIVRTVRKNVFFNSVFNNIFNRTNAILWDSTNSTYRNLTIAGGNNNSAVITWKAMTNGFYNATYNIYCYYNYPG